jgi:Uma2 family endonuclease
MTMATDVRSPMEQLVRDLAEWTPEWQATQVFPVRYPCTEEEYLALDYNRLLEYSDGFLEVLPMPTIFHQLILSFLLRQMHDFVAPEELGTVVPAGYKVWVRPGWYREPDILFIRSEHESAIGKDYCTKADLVIEIVSESNRRHDLVTKKDEYAKAGIPEYWIVDPEEETITVFVLKPRRKTYVEHGVYSKGERAESKLLPGFGVDVTASLTQGPGHLR